MKKHDEALKKYSEGYDFGDDIKGNIKKDNVFKEHRDYINSVVLWKIKRTPAISDDLIKSLLEIRKLQPEDLESEEKIEEIKSLFNRLLECEGVRTAMASTILHFYNENVFPIIDQRAYREIYEGKASPTKEELGHGAFSIYLEYIKKCAEYKRIECDDKSFSKIDKILYQLDKDKQQNVERGKLKGWKF